MKSNTWPIEFFPSFFNLLIAGRIAATWHPSFHGASLHGADFTVTSQNSKRVAAVSALWDKRAGDRLVSSTEKASGNQIVCHGRHQFPDAFFGQTPGNKSNIPRSSDLKEPNKSLVMTTFTWIMWVKITKETVHLTIYIGFYTQIKIIE